MLRPLSINDLDTVVAIEKVVQPSPWSIEIFTHCLNSSGSYGWGFELNENLVGFVFVSFKPKTDAHLLNLCVVPEYRRQGIAKSLLQYVMTEAVNSGVTMMYLEVRASNQPALSLYERAGFSQVGVRKNYYSSASGRENAIIYAMELGLA